MSESQKEKNQDFSDFISLAEKIENILEQTPDLEQENKLINKSSLEQKIDTQAVTFPHTENITEVEQQTSKLEETISGVVDKTGIKVDQQKMEDLVRIEKELIEFYSGAKIQISDFYYKQEKDQEPDIVNRIKSKLQAIEKINLKKIDTLGLPFALCKLEGKYQVIIPIEIDKIKLPTLLVDSNTNLKLLHVTEESMLELTESEKKIWDQAFTRFQIKLTQLIGSRAKENLSKTAPKMKLVNIDLSRIQQYIKEYDEKLNTLQNYQQEILNHLHELEELISKEKSFWKNNEEFTNAKKELKKQLIEFEEKQRQISREAQVEFIKLKKTQRKLDAKTKKFKLDEKRNKTIPRTEKEQLIKEVREFQNQKYLLLENIEHTKKMEDTLKRWVDVISHPDMDQVNKMLIENYSEGLIEKIHSIIDTKDIENLFEDSVVVKSDIQDIIIHVIYIPATIYSFKAKQGDQNIEGKVIFLSPTQEVILLNPAVI